MKVTFCTTSTIGQATVEHKVAVEAEDPAALEGALRAVMDEERRKVVSEVKRRNAEDPTFLQ